MIKIGLALEQPGDRRIHRLRAPAAALAIDQVVRDEVPDPAVPFLILRSDVDRIEEGCRADPLGARPPEAVAEMRLACPVERVVEATALRVPAFGGRTLEECLGGIGQP